MKLNKNEETTTTAVGDLNAKTFGIDTKNGVIFDILRNKMYSNKIAAVAREITSNCRDANRENKKTETPITVQILEPNVLITSSDMQIVFKDSGVGITPDRMDNIFLNYGASTKRNTNKQTGGFGLGAKTPFAYTDTFTVITVCDHEGKRMKYTYTASITDRGGVGSGEMILFNEEETTEETGTSIVVPIKDSDKNEFEQEVLRATAFWKVKPQLMGFESKEWKFKHAHKEAAFSVIEDPEGHFYGKHALLSIDGIPYDVQLNELGLRSGFFSDTGMILLLEFKNGDLTISANREAVQYDRRTRTMLHWRLRQAKRTLIGVLNDKFGEQKTYLDACIFMNSLKGTGLLAAVYREFMNDAKFLFQGKELARSAHFRYHEIFRYETYASDGKLNGIKMSERDYDEKWKLAIYLMDEKKRHSGKNATLVDAGGFILVVPVIVELKEGKDQAQIDHYTKAYEKSLEDQAAEVLTLQGLGVPLNIYSTVVPKILPKGQTDSVYYKRTNEVGVPVRRLSSCGTCNNSESDNITFLRKEKTTATGKLFIYFITNKLSNFGNYAGELPIIPTSEALQQGRIAAKLLNMDFVLVGEKYASYFFDAKMPTIAEAYAQAMALPTFVDTVREALNVKACERLRIEDALEEVSYAKRLSADAVAVVKACKNESKNVLQSLEFNYAVTDATGVEIKPTIDTKAIEAEIKAMIKKYPLMAFFLNNRYYGNRKDQVTQMNKIMDLFDAEEARKKAEEELANPAPVVVKADGKISEE